MFVNAWHWQDAYREKVAQSREEARVRILDPYIVPIIALFQGRVIDKPEQGMAATEYSTGGDVGHKIFMIGGVLFLIIELKLDTPDENALAQLFLELLSAAKENMAIDFAGLRIYGLLTDTTQFRFYSYEPATKKFFYDETIFSDTTRTNAFSKMIDVSNKIFGVVISGYKEGLRATIKISHDRAKRMDFSSMGSSPEPEDQIRQSDSSSARKITGGRKSTSEWESALFWAERCCAMFERPVTSLQDIEETGNDALKLLTKSICFLPRASYFTGDDDPSTTAELQALATRVINKWHRSYLSSVLDSQGAPSQRKKAKAQQVGKEANKQWLKTRRQQLKQKIRKA